VCPLFELVLDGEQGRDKTLYLVQGGGDSGAGAAAGPGDGEDLAPRLADAG
jgi:hypothetical protein